MVHKSGDDTLWARLQVQRSRHWDTRSQSVLSRVHIEWIRLYMSFTSEDELESLSFESLRSNSDHPLFTRLTVACRDPDGPEYRTFKSILRSALQRKQLSWALESDLLWFHREGTSAVISSSDILSMPTEMTIDDDLVSLDVEEQADWLLYRDSETRDEYLRYVQLKATMVVESDFASPVEPAMPVAGFGSR